MPSQPPAAPRSPSWKERSVFFVHRNGTYRVDWLLTVTLMITGSLVGVAGRPLLDKTSESVAMARKWICPVADAAPVATTMALGSVLIGANTPPETAPEPPKSASDQPVGSDPGMAPTLITISHPAGAKTTVASGATAATPRPKDSTRSGTSTGAGSLSAAMRGAAGISEAEANKPAPPPETRGWDEDESAKAEAAKASIPETPAVGALQAAVHPLSSTARACVRDYTEPSHANIVFLSSGRVGDVNVSGPAAGTSAERCIRSAFMRASVAPFRKASYVVGVSVRP